MAVQQVCTWGRERPERCNCQQSTFNCTRCLCSLIWETQCSSLCIIKAYALRKPAELMIPVQPNEQCDHNLLNDYADYKAQFLFIVNSKEFTHEKGINLFCWKLSKRIQIHFINSIGCWNCLHYTQAKLVCKWHFHSQTKSQLREKKMRKKSKHRLTRKVTLAEGNSQEIAFHWRNRAQLGWMLAPWSWLDFHSSLTKRKLEVSISDFLTPSSVGRI